MPVLQNRPPFKALRTMYGVMYAPAIIGLLGLVWWYNSRPEKAFCTVCGKTETWTSTQLLNEDKKYPTLARTLNLNGTNCSRCGSMRAWRA